LHGDATSQDENRRLAIANVDCPFCASHRGDRLRGDNREATLDRAGRSIEQQRFAPQPDRVGTAVSIAILQRKTSATFHNDGKAFPTSQNLSGRTGHRLERTPCILRMGGIHPEDTGKQDSHQATEKSAPCAHQRLLALRNSAAGKSSAVSLPACLVHEPALAAALA
jgi:hypothetical protein